MCISITRWVSDVGQSGIRRYISLLYFPYEWFPKKISRPGTNLLAGAWAAASTIKVNTSEVGWRVVVASTGRLRYC